MSRTALLESLADYADRYPLEGAVVSRIAALVRGHPDCFERSCRPGHVTGSAWVVSRDFQSCLLVHHRKLGRWLQPGGHADGEAEVAAVALREAREESGLTGLELAPLRDGRGNPAPLDVDVHVIPARYGPDGRLTEDAHEHHDLRFLVVGDAAEPPRASAESHAVRWFALDEAAALAGEESVVRMLRKAESWRARGVLDRPSEP